jgi:hypothetical protein
MRLEQVVRACTCARHVYIEFPEQRSLHAKLKKIYLRGRILLAEMGELLVATAVDMS